MKSLKVSVAVLILGLTTPALAQLACPPTQTTPNFNSGGSVFGRIAAQWNVYFGAKVDSTNGCSVNQTLVSPIFSGAPAFTLTLAPYSIAANPTGTTAVSQSVSPLPVNMGGTNATTPGSTAANNIGALSINSNLSDLGSVSTAQTNLGLGSFSTQSYQSPPVIGGTTPNSATFTSLTGTSGTFTSLATGSLTPSGTVSGAGITSLFASPPSIGTTTPGTGNFSTLELSGNALSLYGTGSYKLATVYGAPTNGHCAQWSTSGMIDAGITCSGSATQSAASSWTTSNNTITMATTNPGSVVTGMNVYDATTGYSIGTVSSWSSFTLTLQANATSGSYGSSDSLTFASSGTVTSAGLTGPGGIFSVSGSPVTTAGTLALSVAGTSGGIPYFSSSSALSTSAALTQYEPVLGGGTGAAPTVVAGSPTVGQALTWNSSGPPTWKATVNWPSNTNLVISTGTSTPSGLAPVNNDIVYATGGAFADLATANSGVLVTSSGGVPSISTTLPSGLTIPGYNATVTWPISGRLMLSNGGNAPTSYGGSTCTSQFVSAISINGTATCNPVSNGYLTAGTYSNVTGTGTLTAGATGSGFTIALGSSTVTGTVAAANGGLGANESSATGVVSFASGTSSVSTTLPTGLTIPNPALSSISAGAGVSYLCFNNSTGAVTTNAACGPSDLLLKTNIKTLDGATIVQRLAKLRAVRYHYKDKRMGESEQLGVIANEWEEAFPELVMHSPNGIRGFDYARLAAVLVSAFDDLDAREKQDAADIAQLKKQLH